MPLALADETAAECEDDQPWIGYRQTEFARVLVQPILEDAGIGFEACEGEQWDGQDSVQPEWSAPCSSPAYSVDEARAGFCTTSDPNAASGDDPLNPAGFRASTSQLREGYLAANVALVGRVALYAGTCGDGEAGLEGETSCGGTRELRTGIYVRDNTPGNFVWTMFQCLRSIICHYVSEQDCSHAAYMYSAMTGQPICSRDNTALGGSLILP